jgi:hypothetical protein
MRGLKMKRTYECIAYQEQLTGDNSCNAILVWAKKLTGALGQKPGDSRKSDWPRIMPEQVKEIR